MTYKKAYSSPGVKSEGLTVGVVGCYGCNSRSRGRGKKRGLIKSFVKWWGFK